MSNAAKKKEDTNVSGIFSIQGDPFEEGNIPGVTQLLERKKVEDKKFSNLEPTRTINLKSIPKAPPTAAPNEATRTMIADGLPSSLREIGVLFELRFGPEVGFYRYIGSMGHKESRLLPWQEAIFERMKLDNQSLQTKAPFQEFRAQETPWIFEVFAIQPAHYIQIITPKDSNSKIVLVSDQSISLHKEFIIDAVSKV